MKWEGSPGQVRLSQHPEAGIRKCLKPNSFCVQRCVQNALPHRCAQFGPNSKDTDAFEAEWS